MAETITVTTNEALKKLRLLAGNGKISDLQNVLVFIKHPIEEIRAAASKIAASIIKENLISYYHHMESGVRQKLVLLLETLDAKVIDEISSDLYSDSHARRLHAIQVLGLLKKNPRIRQILAKLITDRDVRVRATAVNLLGKIIGPNDSDIILGLLNDSDQRVRANTVEALEQVNNKRLIPVLIRFRKDPSNRIRANVLKALYNLGYPEIKNDLVTMLDIPDDFMKASALWVVTQIKISSTTIVNTAARHLLSDNEMVARNARNALTALATPRALGFLKYLSFN